MPPTSSGRESGPAIAPGPFPLARLSIGHASDASAHTGVTVLLFEDGARAAVDVRGGAPGTREAAALDPGNLVPSIHALVLTGGSAFGLDAAGGVMRLLEERGRGFPMPEAVVPIVPAAVIYDLRLGGGKRRPDAEMGRAAALAAADPRSSPEGNVGAGAGATVGKALGAAGLVKGGIGLASAKVAGRWTIGALAVVNAFGDVCDPSSGEIVAGCRTEALRSLLAAAASGGGAGLAPALPRGPFADTTRLLSERSLARPAGRGPASPPPPPGDGGGEPSAFPGGDPALPPGGAAPLPSPRPGESTTLVALVTDAPLSRTALQRVAKMGHDGLARAIRPVHTPYDGDVVYAISTAEEEDPTQDGLAAGAVGAEVAAAAIVRGVLSARSVPGAPCAADVRAP
jgi:L-aminopeptidase/D-esterase-like protein